MLNLNQKCTSQWTPVFLTIENISLNETPVDKIYFCSLLDVADRIQPYKIRWDCPTIEKSIVTQDRALGHIMRPKLQIPFRVYGIMAITWQSTLAVSLHSLPIILGYNGSEYMQKDGFQNKCQHPENLNS